MVYSKMRLRNDTSASTVKNVAKKSTGTRPFQSTSSTITENEEETETVQSVRRGRSSKFSELESSNGEERDTTEQPSCSHRGRPRNVHEKTLKLQIDDEWEVLLECHNRRRGRPRKVLEETPNEMTSGNDSNVLVSPRKSVAKKSTGTRAIQSTNLQKFQNVDEHEILLECHNRRRGRPRKVLEETSNTGKEHGMRPQSLNCRRGRSRKFLEGMSSDVTNDVEEEQSKPDSDMMGDEEESSEDQETLLLSQHCHVSLSRKVLEGLSDDVTNDVEEKQSEPDSDMMVDEEEETTLENDTSVPASSRKSVAKKSTGTRAIQSKSKQQNDDKQKIPQESHHHHRTRPRKVLEKTSNEMSQDKIITASFPLSYKAQNEQNDPGVDLIASDVEDVTNDVQEEQAESDVDIIIAEEEQSRHHYPQRPRKVHERLSSEESQDKNKIISFPATHKAQECTLVFDSVTTDFYDDTMTSGVEEMNLGTDTNISVSPRKNVAKKSTGTRAPQSKTQQQSNKETETTQQSYYGNPLQVRKVHREMSGEESSHRNRKNPVRSRKKMQKKQVDDDYEESDEESPNRNRKKSARSPRKTQKNHVDSDQDYEDADEEGPSTSRIRSRNIGETDIETLVHKCVYYLLIADQKKHAIKKTDIMKHVIKGPQQCYSDVIDGANEVLKKTYGMEITQLRKGNLMLINNLTQELDVQQYSCLILDIAALKV